jgi:hypothetical protein
VVVPDVEALVQETEEASESGDGSFSDKFRSVLEIHARLEALASQHKTRAKTVNIGKSKHGRNLIVSGLLCSVLCGPLYVQRPRPDCVLDTWGTLQGLSIGTGPKEIIILGQLRPHPAQPHQFVPGVRWAACPRVDRSCCPPPFC